MAVSTHPPTVPLMQRVGETRAVVESVHVLVVEFHTACPFPPSILGQIVEPLELFNSTVTTACARGRLPMPASANPDKTSRTIIESLLLSNRFRNLTQTSTLQTAI